MQLKDVVVGEEYEYRKWAGYEKVKVKVIEVGVDVPYYDYKGALVQHENGRRVAVVARCLLKPWKEAVVQNERVKAKAAKDRAVVSKLQDARLDIEYAFHATGICAATSIWETRNPALVIKFTDPAEAEKFAALIGGAE